MTVPDANDEHGMELHPETSRLWNIYLESIQNQNGKVALIRELAQLDMKIGGRVIIDLMSQLALAVSALELSRQET